MKIVGGTVRLAATDLSNHLFCSHLTALNLAEVRGVRKAPPVRAPDLVVLQQRGLDHEKAYIAILRATGMSIRDLSGANAEDYAVAETLAAMASGIDVIVQGALRSGNWFGRPDVLQKVEVPGSPDAWTYEPYDCKLARETKAATILQISHYAALIGLMNGHEPENMFVVPPSSDFRAEPYRVLDYAAYYRAIRRRLDEALAANRDTYPEPTEHCDVCRWWQDCDRQWRRDDHLSLTAGISRLQRKQLVEWEIPTMEALSRMKVPLVNKPRYGSREGYVRVREQARVQISARYQKQPVHELLTLEPDRGFLRLPEPSPGDIFFDLESDPYVATRGREYLFGFGVQAPYGQFTYERRWAFTASEEKAAFEWFIDFAMEHWKEYPTMHIYHFGHKEPSTLKALMGLYATREDAMDRMLRSGVLVDLHSIAKQAVRASVERYSLKALEEFHGFKRDVPLDDARAALRQVEHGLELNRITSVDPSVGKIVEGYNSDDCRSTLALRTWLETLRLAQIGAGAAIPRPVAQDGAPSDILGARQARVASLIQNLTADVPADESLRSEEQAARWLLANLLDWHRREEKVAYWEKYRLRDLGDEELRDERAAIGGLDFIKEIPPDGRKKLPIHEYSFPPQETSLGVGDKVYNRGLQIGTIEYIDPVVGVVGVRKTSKAIEVHPQSFYSYEIVRTEELADSLFRFAEHVSTRGLDFARPYQVACALLLRRPPSVALLRATEPVVEAAKRIVLEMSDSVLPIQGPPAQARHSRRGK